MTALLLLVVVPLFVVAPGVFVNQSSTPKMLAIALGLYLVLRPAIRPRAEATREVLAFFGVCCLSWIFAANHWIAFAGSYKAPYYGIFPMVLVALAYLGSTVIEEDPLPLLAWSGAALGAVAVAQVFLGSSFTGMPLQGGRAVGLRGSPVMLGATLIPCLLAAWYLMRENSRWIGSNRSSMGPAWRRWAPIVLIAGGMIAAKAKGAMVASIAGIWAYETVGAMRWAGLAAALGSLWSSLVYAPIQNNGERLELLKIAWSAFKQRPLLGWGPDNFLIALLKLRTPEYIRLAGPSVGQASAHQDLAQVAATLGLAGLGSYLWMIWALIRSSLEYPLSVAVIVAMVFQAQVNPIPTDVLVAAAVIVGSRSFPNSGRWWGEGAETPAWLGPAVLCCAIALAVLDLTPWARGIFR